MSDISKKTVLLNEFNFFISNLKQICQKNKSLKELLIPFIKEFDESKKNLKSNGDNIIELEHLHPFFEIIKCEDIDGAITVLALKSLYKIISYNLIDADQDTAPEITLGIIESVTRARFMSSTITSDEVVLLEILNVLKKLIENPLNKYISDDAMCECMQSCFRICFELRLSEVLRRTAELVLVQFSIVLFDKTKKLISQAEVGGKGAKIQKRLSYDDKSNNAKSKTFHLSTFSKKGKSNTIKSQIVAKKENFSDFIDDSSLRDSIYANKKKQTLEGLNNVESSLKRSLTAIESIGHSEDNNLNLLTLGIAPNPSMEDILRDSESLCETVSNQSSRRFYGIQCVNEYFRFLVTLTDPFNKYNKREFLELGLSLLIVCFEVGISNIKHSEILIYLIKEELCRNIYEIFYHDSLVLFTISLNIFTMLLLELRTCIKYQLEHLFTALLDMCSVDSTKVSLEKKDIIYDFILKIADDGILLTEIFINFDAQLTSLNIFERFVTVLTHVVLSPQANIKALHALLTLIFSIDNDALYIQSESGSTHSGLSDNYAKLEEIIINSLKLKPLYNEGIELLNSSLSRGIQHFQKHNIFPAKEFEPMLAQIFKYDLRVSKIVVGDSIGNRKYPNLLSAYVNCFDVEGIRIDKALRSFLESFRIPGESPVISRIMETFSSYYFEHNPTLFSNKDAVFTLTYAMIMLNVDQHNSNVKMQKSMILEDFVNNLKGVDGGKDFSYDLLKEIFNSIRQSEIIVPSERVGTVKQTYIWKLSVEKSNKVPYTYHSIHQIILRKYMFKIVCNYSLNCLFGFLNSSFPSSLIQKVLYGLKILAKLSSVYNSYETIDKIIINLLKYSNMVQIVSQNKLEPDQIIAELGLNTTSQICLTSCFKMVHTHSDCLNLSWKYIVASISNFCSSELLKINMYEFEDFVNTSGRFFLKMGKNITPLSNETISSGFINSFVQLIITNPDINETQNNEDVFKIAQNVVSHCNIEELMNETKQIQDSSFLELYKCLISFASLTPCKIPFNLDSPDFPDVSYISSPSTATFFVETLVTIALYNKHRIDLFITELILTLFQLTSKASQITILNERAVVGLLRLCIRLMDLPNAIPNKLMLTVRSLIINSPLITACSNSLTFGLHELVKTCFLFITSGWDWVCILELLEISGAGRLSVLTSVSVHPQIIDESLLNENYHLNPEQSSLHDIHMSEIHQQKALYDAIDDGGRDELSYKSVNCFNKFNPLSFRKSMQTLIFLIREQPCHLTHLNILPCVHAMTTFSEHLNMLSRQQALYLSSTKDRRYTAASKVQQQSINNLEHEKIDCQDIEENINIILELMYILIGKSSKVLLEYMCAHEPQSLSANECRVFLWYSCWSRLLKRIAIFINDPVRSIRLSSLHFLQRALLIDDLQIMSKSEWYLCFDQILFPMLRILSLEAYDIDTAEFDETRVRALTLVSKLFLQNLQELSANESFPKLWARMLQTLEKYKKCKSTDVLQEAIPEYLKNILLVITTGGIMNIHDPSPISLWNETYAKIRSFLPDFSLDFLYLANSPIPPSSLASETSIPAMVPPPTEEIVHSHEAKLVSRETLFTSHNNLPLDMPNFKIITTPSNKT